MKPHVFHPEAREEYIQAVRYYSDARPELGARLYEEIERLIQEIRREPARFFEFSPPSRRALARRFRTPWFIWTNPSACGSLQ